MNNTKTILAAIFIAATLVVAGTFAATTTQSAFASFPKKDHKKDNKKDNGGNGNGNTVTIQKCKQAATQSGFDNNQGQECENVICTHPGSNATCVSEGAAAVSPVSNQTGGGGGVCNSPLVLARIDGVTICVDPSTLLPPVGGGGCRLGEIEVTVDSTVIGCISIGT
jgi:hypothetical protein